MEILDIVAYFIKNSKEELTKGRLNKLIYLADWKNCLEYNKQLTNIKWKFNHYGPYIDKIQEEINNDVYKRIDIKSKKTKFGNPKYVVEISKNKDFVEPNENQKKF
ncbi:SocA family protein [Campylobacter lari]|nr:SocA family protein [Campylobacter lari]